MNTRRLDELVDDIIEERNDRALIILCSSAIDEQLFNILDSFLKEPLTKNDDLLKGDNPLSTFSSRIKLLYRLGIIDNSLREILDNIRKIRNLCAHSIELNINQSPIKDHITTLRNSIIKKEIYKLTLKRYFENKINNYNEIKVLFVTIYVLLEAINLSVVKIATNNKTVKISTR